MKQLKNLINYENKTKLIGLLTILIILWVVLYLLPELFNTLFNTFLGNLILVTMLLLVSMYDLHYGIFLSIIFIIIFRFSYLSRNPVSKEGFEWSPKSTRDFLQIQNSINPQKVFDINMIKKTQASQEEVDYFNERGVWPWSQTTIKLYENAVNSSPFIRTLPEDSVNYARTIYNEAAILRIISYQTKEGQFLLNGILVKDTPNKYEDLPNGFGDFALSKESGLLENRSNDIIKCNMKNSNDSILERITYTGKGGIFGEQTSKTIPVDYKNLEKIIPGFTFLNGPCNPCGAVNESPDYSCPFRLKVKNKPPFVSGVWQNLWDINDNPIQSTPSFLNETINKDKFPLLSELQTELKKQK
jgi:hypothetical protein